ncbi:MAG: hypothetical protein BMS9Abin07_2017 [Acidimicrobiia bacterium]|nr:MAG: hypothetical protein BMS9Abin07_2017 [Acidimicrobiia bacterium]
MRRSRVAKPYTRKSVLIVGIAVVAAACGGSEDGSPTTTTAAPLDGTSTTTAAALLDGTSTTTTAALLDGAVTSLLDGRGAKSEVVGDPVAAPWTTLSDVAEACAEGNPGIAIVIDQLRDANVTVDLPDCVIHLEQGADVQLDNVTITGGIINLYDLGTAPSTNTIVLDNVTIDTVAFLIELSDADDSLDMSATDITTALGIGLQVVGTRDDANEGGDIRLVGSSLLATDLDATIQILASEQSGKIRLVGTTVDTQGFLFVLAADCKAELDGEVLDCSTATVIEELG